MIELLAKCDICHNVYHLKVEEKDYEKYAHDSNVFVQDCFPYLNEDERELLISHICGTCWDELIG